MSRPLTELITIAKQNNLSGVELLDDFSYLELARIYNGIGPDRFPDWLRVIVTEANGLFEPAALIHDVEYYIGGTKENFTAANDRFRSNCYALVKAAYSWYDPRRYKWLFRAWRYAGYCQEFGWSGFHKTAEPCECTRCEKSDLDAGNSETAEVTASADVAVEVSEDEPETEQPVKKKKKSKKKGKGKK
jgi:hypothetical protein